MALTWPSLPPSSCSCSSQHFPWGHRQVGVGLPSPSLVSSVPTQLLSGPLPEDLWVGGLAPHCSLPSLRLQGRKYL